MTDRLIIDARELADMLSVPLSSIRRGFGPPALSGYGRRKRWRRADVEAWIAKLPVEQPKENDECRSAEDQVADSSTRDSKSTAAASSGARGSRPSRRIDPLLERKPRQSKPKKDEPPAQVIPLRPGAGR